MKGRVALYEMMLITPPLRELIAKSPTTDQIRSLARQEGMLTLHEAGLRRVLEGIATPDEILRVTSNY